jgi:hypothetical protein
LKKVNFILAVKYRLVDKYMRQPPPLGSRVCLSGWRISTVSTLRKVK